jgi:hypothetical protein
MALEEYLLRIAKNLRRTIPAPREEPAKAQASWQKLKAGQRLKSKLPVKSLNGSSIGDPTVFEVMSCSNKGAMLKPLDVDSQLGRVLWKDREWERVFERVRASK